MRCLVLLLALVPLYASAFDAADLAPEVVGLHLLSRHNYSKTDPIGANFENNRNPGIYARWGNGLTVGTYRNSQRLQTYYFGRTFTDENTHVSITVGAMYGYATVTGYHNRPDLPGHSGNRVTTLCNSKKFCWQVDMQTHWLPMLVPSVALPITERLSARLSAVVNPKEPPVVHLSLEYKL